MSWLKKVSPRRNARSTRSRRASHRVSGQKARQIESLEARRVFTTTWAVDAGADRVETADFAQALETGNLVKQTNTFVGRNGTTQTVAFADPQSIGLNDPVVHSSASNGPSAFESNGNPGWISVESGNTISIHGTNDEDSVTVQYLGAPIAPGSPIRQFVHISLDNDLKYQQKLLPWHQVAKVEFFAHDGNDSFVNSTFVPSLVEGGSGNDSLQGGMNADDLRGRAGNDSINGGAGNDSLWGGDGNDNIVGGSGADIVAGNEGSDILQGGSGDDTVSGGTQNDWVFGDAGNDLVSGDGGNDTVYGGDGQDEAWGGVGNDNVYGGGGNDLVRGWSGNDNVRGDAGNDDVRGDSGDDYVYGNGGNDTLRGDAGLDRLYGSSGNDTIRGGSDRDTMYGGSGSDQMYGDDGSDIIYGDAGNDVIRGGNGNDTIRAGSGNDTVYGQAHDDSIYGDGGNDTLWGYTGNDRIFGGDGNDSLDGYSGDDLIFGGNDDDYIEGDSGNDTIDGDAGNDTIHGGSGNDEIFGDSGHDHLYGNSGNDDMGGGSGFDYMHGGTGNDLMRGDSGEDTMYGAEGHDIMFGGDGDDEMYGGSGNDRLYGGANADNMEGNAGIDGLYGGTGANDLDGGSGSDRFLVLSSSPQSNHYDGYDETEDAWIYFNDGDSIVIDFLGFDGDYEYAAGSWNDADIARVDDALQTLHLKTGNKTLLERANGDAISFTMYGENLSSPEDSNSSFLGFNGGANIGILENGDFSDASMKKLVFHEIGHNWDGENPDWQGWMDLSGWTQEEPTPIGMLFYTEAGSSDQEWWYLNDADFARNYGRTNPFEDFATSFTLYFMDEIGEEYTGLGAVEAEDIPTKIAFLDAFFASIS